MNSLHIGLFLSWLQMGAPKDMHSTLLEPVFSGCPAQVDSISDDPYILDDPLIAHVVCAAQTW